MTTTPARSIAAPPLPAVKLQQRSNRRTYKTTSPDVQILMRSPWDLATILYDLIYCEVVNRVPASELSSRIQQHWHSLLSGYQTIRPHFIPDLALLQKFVILREAVIYVHYRRIFAHKTISESFRAGMDEMRQNVESRTLPFRLTGT